MPSPSAWAASGQPLTRRELEVITTVATVGSTKDAAVKLGIAPQTVAEHLANIRVKTGSRSTLQAAWKLGLTVQGSSTASTQKAG